MNKFCKFKIYFIALFIGIIIAVGVLAVNYYNFLQEPKLIINYEYQMSKILRKKDKQNKIIAYRLNLTKYYLNHKKNWLNISKEMLLLYPIDKSLILSKKIGVAAYKMVKFDKTVINELKTIYGGKKW
ncbi:MAG: hypothetical protein ACYDEG_07925 [bacterium]